MKEKTIIQVEKVIAKKLKKNKITKNESYNEIIKRLLKEHDKKRN